MKVRALPKFEGIRDKERSQKEGKDIFPKAGDIWEVSEERANFLKEHGVIEIIEEESKTDIIEKTIEERIEDIRNMDVGEPIPKEKFEKIKKEFELKPKKKKASKK